ncbi:MAG: cupin domain-containing protein [Vicinamibacterales bacterium]
MTDEIPEGEAVSLVSLVTPTPGGVASRVLAKSPGGSLTLFQIDAGQGLREHASPHDASVLVLEGDVRLTIGGASVSAPPGSLVRLPAHVPHAVDARTAARFLLVVLR